MKSRVLSILAALALISTSPVLAGSIFVTGHDPIWHAAIGSNALGAQNLALTGIDYARNGSSLPFLFVESKTVPVPSGNFHEAGFLVSALGFSTADFDVMDAAELAALVDFRATLDSYSAIVVASDHGGMLTAAELSFLNANSAHIIDYLNDGGGLFAAAESNAVGLIGATPRFGFLPFLVSSADFQAFEVGNTVTPFGAGLGLTDFDVNGNFSHNFFSSTGGMNPVDLFNGNSEMPLTLAFRGTVGPSGVPEPGTLLLVGLGVFAVLTRRRA